MSLARLLGLVGTGTGAPFGGGSRAAGLPEGDFTLLVGLSIGLQIPGQATAFVEDFINSPGTSTVFEVSRSAAGPYTPSLALDCVDAAASPVTVYVRATAPVLTASKTTLAQIVSNGWCE